jgi:hypothetical protein
VIEWPTFDMSHPESSKYHLSKAGLQHCRKTFRAAQPDIPSWVALCFENGDKSENPTWIAKRGIWCSIGRGK